MSDLEKQLEIFERRLKRERAARKEAEHILEERGRELFYANKSLRQAYENQEQVIEERTQALREARDEALRANRAKSSFLSSMSHELRTPLNAIIGYSQVLMMDELSEDQVDSIREIETAGQHLLSLINEILDLSRVEAGKMTLSIEDVSLENIFAESQSLQKPIAERFSIKVDYQPCSFFVRADYTRLKQVLINLISNAIKYNRDNGSVTVSAQTIENDFVRIQIADTGPGIPEEKHTGLFEPFNRLGAETSGIEGTGIGLMITTQLTEMMGGRVGFESKIDVGSTFWIDMPLSQQKQAVEAEITATELEDMSNRVEKNNSKRILYIEDNPANMRLMEQIIARNADYQLIKANEPVLGLEMAEKESPDLLLVDINLSVMDGCEVLENHKSIPFTEHLSVIAVTANAMKDNITQGVEAGFDDYLTKPLDVKSLLSTIANFME